MTATPAPTRAPLHAAFVALTGTAVVAVGNPTTHHVPLCFFHATTGLDCPFCGGLRAVFELSRFDVPAALGYNALVVLGLPVAVLLWFDWLARAHRGLPSRHRPRWLRLSVIVLVVAFGIVRNLPFGAALAAQ